MSPTAKTILWVLGGLTVGGAAAYALAQHRRVKEIAENLPPAITEWRLPRPDYSIHLPDTAEDHQVIDDVVCECLVLSKGTEPEDLVEEVRMCAAKRLAPDFAWPPVSGDHPSVQTLWAILGFEASRAITMNICPVSVPTTAMRRGREMARRR